MRLFGADDAQVSVSVREICTLNHSRRLKYPMELNRVMLCAANGSRITCSGMLAVAATVALLILVPPESRADAITVITIANDSAVPGCETTQSCLDPYSVTVIRGEMILWKNPTDSLHAIISGNPNAIKDTFNIGPIEPGHSAGLVLDRLGSQQYFCAIHPWIAGIIHVTDAPRTGYDPPLHQYNAGIHPEHVTCKEDMHLAYRTSDASPICLKKSSLEKFVERGLAIPSFGTGDTPDRINADKERFVRLLSDYIWHDGAVVITDNIDRVEEYVEKNEYKAEVIEQIRDEFRRNMPVPVPNWGDIVIVPELDDGSGMADPNMLIRSPPPQGTRVSEGPAETQLGQAGAPYAEYSQTNVQVQGVDEPDFVKNDADSIYVIAQNDNVAMVDVDSTGRILPPGVSPYVKGAEYMLLHQDTLAVLSDDGYGFTTVTLLDVSSGPSILAELGLDSELRDARMIDGTVYVMTSSDIDEPPTLYDLRNDEQDDAYKVHFFKGSLEAEELYTITAIPLDDTAQARSSSFVLGDTDTVYVSRDNAYISHTQEYEVPRALFADGLFFRYVIDTLEPYELAELYFISAHGGVERMAEFVLASFTWEDVSGLVARLEAGASTAWDPYAQGTAIHKVAIDGTEIRYVASGSVDGTLLNSFALNQGEDGMLRVITSTNVNGLQTNVYTLDESMDEVGSLEGIAPGETLHSARFSGDWLYAVTFRQVDPFFVIDVSDIKPKILGVLKIPGYSEYLQNYDDTHVIGIGRDTNQNMFDATEDAGIKISMFDVSDFENPREVQSIIVGDQSTDSAGLAEHKSLLIDDSKRILSIPIRFSGELFFYVYSVNDDYTMDVHSKIPHAYDESNPHHMRSLYIGDVLYTVTPKMIKANDLLQPDVSIGSLEI